MSRGHSRVASAPLGFPYQDKLLLEHAHAVPKDSSRSAPTSPHPGRRLLAGRKRRAQLRSSHGRKSKLNDGKRSSVLVQTPGYTLSRSTNRVKMDINTSAFFGETPMHSMVERCKSVDIPPVSNEIRMRSLLDEAKRAQDSLQRDVVELTSKLDQQQQTHQEHINELEQTFEERQNNVAKSHQKDIRDLKDKHNKDAEDLINKHELELQTLQQLWDLEKDKLEGDLEATKQLMEEVKVQMVAEVKERLQKKEEELKLTHESELKEQEQLLTKQAEQDQADLRELLKLQHTKEMDRMAAEHKQEKRDLLAQLDDVAKVEQQLNISKRRVKKLEGEVENLKRTQEDTNTQQLNVESKLLDTQRKLRDFERSFNAKVQSVESSYKDRLDNLMRENSQLRMRLLHKTEQHSQYKVVVENSQSKTLRTYQDKMNVILRARSRAELCSVPGTKPRAKKLGQRPYSAPALCAVARKPRSSYNYMQ